MNHKRPQNTSSLYTTATTTIRGLREKMNEGRDKKKSVCIYITTTTTTTISFTRVDYFVFFANGRSYTETIARPSREEDREAVGQLEIEMKKTITESHLIDILTNL